MVVKSHDQRAKRAIENMPLERQQISQAASVLLISMTAAFGVKDGACAADDFHLGILEYEISCMPCHGVDGRGHGPKAGTLNVAPANLTKITKANDGKFPTQKIADIIDGRAVIASHGTRDMPIWGERYRVSVPGLSTTWVEQRARTQIQALVSYLRSIQE
jgi:mono/diheme cytochrome c family protein